MIGTAFFFHHLNIAEAKGWSGEWITGTYIFYALAGIITVLLAGPLVDRFRAVRVIQVMLIPLVGACFMLAVADHAFWVIPYMLMMGIHTGLIHTSASALWAELYGPKYLGAIKSLYLALMVFASALGPVAMGMLMDAGLSIYWICSFFGIFIAAGAVLIVVALRIKPNIPQNQPA
jgi:MFS family permease